MLILGCSYLTFFDDPAVTGKGKRPFDPTGCQPASSELAQGRSRKKLKSKHPKAKKSSSSKKSSTPSKKTPVQPIGRRYSTRHSSKLTSKFTNTSSDPVDIFTSPSDSETNFDSSESAGKSSSTSMILIMVGVFGLSLYHW